MMRYRGVALWPTSEDHDDICGMHMFAVRVKESKWDSASRPIR